MAIEFCASDVRAAIRAGDTKRVFDLLGADQKRLQLTSPFGTWLHFAASEGKLDIVKRLVDLGADINKKDGVFETGAITDAASEGRRDVVEFLIDQGAEFDISEPERNPLFAAIQNGHMSVAQLLVDSGMNFRVKYSGDLMDGMDALRFAREWGQDDIAKMLIEKLGSDAPTEEELQRDTGRPKPSSKSFIEHLSQHLGEPEPLALREILPTDLPIAIHVIRTEDEQILVTEGMSARPMTVPAGGEAFQFAELVLRLPSDWPLTLDAFANPNHYWPIEWLKRIARYPHDNETWLGGPHTIIANGEPPEPFAPNTKMSCLMLLANPSEFGRWTRPSDGAEVVFYDVFGLYTEERDLELREGLPALLNRFQSRFISKVLDPQRPNVAL